MAKLNVPVKRPVKSTHEGATASNINAKQQLERTIMTCLLWEKNFYEEGQYVADRIASLVPKVKAHDVADLAVSARNKMNLRHAPLLVAREMARASDDHRRFVPQVLSEIIQRADELTEFLSIYWKDGKTPIANSVKRGLAKAFTKFNEHKLAKYNRDGAIKLRDVLFMVHAKPKDDDQDKLWKKLIDGKLAIPDTWETQLSAGKDKKETWTRLINENKLGALAFLRNIRNMLESGLDKKFIFSHMAEVDFSKVFPYQILSAAKMVPQVEPELEKIFLNSFTGRNNILGGKNVVVVDVSGSMDAALSEKSIMTRIDAASSLAMILRESCEDVDVFTFSNKLIRVPARRGMALRDAIFTSQQHGGTDLGGAVQKLASEEKNADRVIIITDEQSQSPLPAGHPWERAYILNVAPYQNGIGYGKWVHINGWSDHVIRFISAIEETSFD